MDPVSASQRITIHESPAEFEIVISSSRNPSITISYPLMIIIWGIVAYSILSSYYSNESGSDKIFLLVGLAMCSLFSVMIIHTWIFNLVGKERIRINHQGLSVKLDIYGFGINRTYDLRHVSKFRHEERRGSFTPFLPGHYRKIVFNYKDDTCGFGVFHDETEAQAIIDKLRMRHDAARLGITPGVQAR